MFVVLDLETTWLSANDDTIIEVAFVKIRREDFKEVDRYTTFVNPWREIPALISQITNIFDTDVEDAPRISEISDDIEDFIEWFPLIGHNISFDIRFLESHGIDTSKNPKLDTFFLANILCFHEKSLNLWYLCESFWISLENAHRAIDDTVATWMLFWKLISKLKKQATDDEWVTKLFLQECSDVASRIIIQEYLSDIKPAIRTNIAESYVTKIEKNKWDKHDFLYDNSGLSNIDFLDKLAWFETRESQKIMIDKVDNTFAKWEKLIIEAPTGIWKTFAYLIPAIKHSLTFWEAVHVSTSTKALQDQIYYKDLDFLSENYPAAFSYTKLKWKRNYLSISQFLEFIDMRESRSWVETAFILKVYFWSLKSDFWELDELDYYWEEYSFISDIHAGNAFVFDESNPYKWSEFAVRAREKAKKSNIVITNNHILFQDASSEWSILWWVKNLVIDEAHALEDVVSQSLKRSISYDGFTKSLLKVENKLIKNKHSHNLFAAKKQELLFDLAELMSLLEGKIFESFSMNARYKTILLKAQDLEWQKQHILLASKSIESLQDLVKMLDDMSEKKNIYQWEIQVLGSFIQILNEVFIEQDFAKNIMYLSHDDNYGTQLFITVLKPGDFLKNNLWNKLESVVLTSATLQMQGSFTYISNILDLQGFHELQLESSFDYKKQALVYVPNDLWSVKNNLEELIAFLEQFYFKVWGNTLTLFTAFSVIREVYSRLKISLQQKEISLLAQSISGSKHKQIDHFKKHADNSILLGTDSFWEWVDIPGSNLQYLLIHKIPFPVPSDPIFQARSQLFKDSFLDYAIPKSIIKLKQWFGRLIRTQEDTWIVVFLDDRIFTTRWWENFLSAFPKEVTVKYWKSENLLKIL